MSAWWRKQDPAGREHAIAESVRARYNSFRELLALNNESLELIATLQEDLQFVPPVMYMTGVATMNWDVKQFLAGNYAFRIEGDPADAVGAGR